MTILARKSGESTKDFAARILASQKTNNPAPDHQVAAAKRVSKP